MYLPKPRGSLSEAAFDLLRSLPDDQASETGVGVQPDSTEDADLTLWAVHELSYGGFEDVHEQAETSPPVLLLRARLETDLEARLRGRWTGAQPAPADVPAELVRLVAEHDGPSLAEHVHRRADLDQVMELLRQRSVYHLKEADQSAWVVPRLPVRAKTALVELLFDEYGDGDPNRLHAHLFAQGLEAVGLRSDYGAYVDDALPEVFEMNNAASMFGMQRRLRGAAMGHLAAFEATSSLPSRRMVQGFARLGLPKEMVRYYDEHVEADAIHEQTALRDICGTLAEEQPEQAGDILFGAFTCLDLEARFATAMLDRWGVAS
ncbi:iron-containing redox enzyme family protein [Nocardioides allogilvus]|uniref:iron-containing redox enzyme family protein n=1 Tax=Nocardioides allogilvus TaxID=2072017 RepID=UPI000D316BAF|nr:iron-containing redox enzyme family protein [Nocardioides allogilvus]